jgi:hypothetical protein
LKKEMAEAIEFQLEGLHLDGERVPVPRAEAISNPYLPIC